MPVFHSLLSKLLVVPSGKSVKWNLLFCIAIESFCNESVSDSTRNSSEAQVVGRNYQNL